MLDVTYGKKGQLPLASMAKALWPLPGRGAADLTYRGNRAIISNDSSFISRDAYCHEVQTCPSVRIPTPTLFLYLKDLEGAEVARDP